MVLRGSVMNRSDICNHWFLVTARLEYVSVIVLSLNDQSFFFFCLSHVYKGYLHVLIGPEENVIESVDRHCLEKNPCIVDLKLNLILLTKLLMTKLLNLIFKYWTHFLKQTTKEKVYRPQSCFIPLKGQRDPWDTKISDRLWKEFQQT